MLRTRKVSVSLALITAGVLMVACDRSAGSSIVLGPAGVPAIGISGDSMHRLATNASRWSSGKKAKRKCKGGLKCFAGKTVDVELFADTADRSYGPSTTGNPILVGKLVNLGDATTAMYGLAPGGYNYLLWVIPGGNADTGRFAIVQVDTASSHNIQTVASGKQIGCGHSTTWTEAFAVFISCEDGPPPPPARATGDASHSPAHIKRAGFFSFAGLLGLAFGHEDPAWFTCTSGCCTAGEPQ